MSNKNFQLEVISPEGVLFDDSCYLAVIPSVLGDIGVMHSHEMVVAVLRSGQISIYNDKNSLVKAFDVESGCATMQTAEKLVVLIN